MGKRIFRAICLITLLALAASLALILVSSYRSFFSVQEQHLRNQLRLAANGVQVAGEKYFDAVTIEGVRVTWISSDGTVLYDNESSASAMENHLERPEIKEAIEIGYSESSRYSSTLLEKQIYCAQRLADGSVIRVSDKLSTALTQLLNLARPIAAMVLLVLLFAFLAASGVAKKITEPVNNIDLDHPETVRTYGELTPLLSRLSAQQAQLRQDKEELLKTEQIRRDFTANVSHELKTPLHAISGYAELIHRGVAAEEDIKPFAGKIHDEAVRMSRLVEDVIDLSRLDAGAVGQKKENTDLYRIAENAVESLEAFAAEKDVTLTLTGAPAPMAGAPELLHSIVYNLCDNAVKYNRAGGSVTVLVEPVPGAVLLTVGDTGIGIPEEHLSRLFERFYRVDKSHSKAVGGTGLGLSIVKHAAAFHYAELSVKSEPGVGTEVSVRFPQT